MKWRPPLVTVLLWLLRRPGREGVPHDFPVISHEDGLFGKGWRRPDNIPPKGCVTRIDQVGPVAFGVARRTKLRDDEVTGFSKQEESVVVAGEERGAAASESPRQRTATAQDHFATRDGYHAEVSLLVKATEVTIEHKRLHVHR